MEDLRAATPDSPQRSGLWTNARFRWIGASFVLLLVAAGVSTVVLSADGGERSPATGAVSPSAVVPYHPRESATSPPTVSPTAEPIELLFAVEASLTRVVPAASLESPEMSIIHTGGGPSIRLYGLLRIGDRVGALNGVISTSQDPMTCDGYLGCDVGPGRCDSTIRRVEIARPVPQGQPRDLEFRVAVRAKDGVLVHVLLDNATATLQPGGPAPAHTGQNPPINLAQLADFAQDPALNVLSTSEAGTCT